MYAMTDKQQQRGLGPIPKNTAGRDRRPEGSLDILQRHAGNAYLANAQSGLSSGEWRIQRDVAVKPEEDEDQGPLQRASVEPSDMEERKEDEDQGPLQRASVEPSDMEERKEDEDQGPLQRASIEPSDMEDRQEDEEKRSVFQAKRIVGPSDDTYEQEADRVADSVVNGSHKIQTVTQPTLSPVVQRQEEQEEQPEQIKPSEEQPEQTKPSNVDEESPKVGFTVTGPPFALRTSLFGVDLGAIAAYMNTRLGTSSAGDSQRRAQNNASFDAYLTQGQRTDLERRSTDHLVDSHRQFLTQGQRTDLEQQSTDNVFDSHRQYLTNIFEQSRRRATEPYYISPYRSPSPTWSSATPGNGSNLSQQTWEPSYLPTSAQATEPYYISPYRSLYRSPWQNSPLNYTPPIIPPIMMPADEPTPNQPVEPEKKPDEEQLQRKLSIGTSNDPLEQEADRVAGQVLAAPAKTAVSAAIPSIQRYTGKAAGAEATAPASVDRALASSGRPLEPAVRQYMEPRFGHDFSHVRVHTGNAAEQSAREVNAHAYTAGHNIVFGTGRFEPETHEGQRLLAHELTHVVQQRGGAG